MKHNRTRRIYPRTDVDFSTGLPPGFSGAVYFEMLMLAFALVAILSGAAFELTKYVIFEIRRHIYNRNRNIKYTAKKAKLQTKSKEKNHRPWRVKTQIWRNPPRPLPPRVTENLCEQWNKVNDSLEEMLKFGEMLIELENYVDNAFKFNGDVIVGRAPGMKGFLEEHCPHIGYKTAMYYRSLALKARAITHKQRNTAKIHKVCTTICNLQKYLDAHLGAERQHLEHPRRRQLRHRGRRNPQPSIFFIRDEVQTAAERLNDDQRQRLISALQEIVRELSVS